MRIHCAKSTEGEAIGESLAPQTVNARAGTTLPDDHEKICSSTLALTMDDCASPSASIPVVHPCYRNRIFYGPDVEHLPVR